MGLKGDSGEKHPSLSVIPGSRGQTCRRRGEGQGWGAGEETAEEEGQTSADSGDISTPMRVLGGGTSPLPRFLRLGQELGRSEGLPGPAQLTS